MSRGGRHLTERAVSAGDLASLVDAFREDLERAGGVRSEESGSRLSEVLLDPISDRIRGADTLVFVPDEVLHAVPFAALTDPGTRRYLVENHAIVVAPSFSLFLHATGRAALDAGAPTSILAVGDPAFDAAAFPSVPRLPMAAAESEKIASLYPDSLVLTAEAATRSRFLEALGSHSVVHVAAHAIGSDADPLRSRLLLAPDPARHDPGTLFADELSTRSFDNVRLVVLAACSTASGKISRGEGPLSLVRPFLAGGVPVVVATLWEIEDASSAELLVRFHRGVAAGRAPEEALREAQVAMIGAENDAERGPHTWAAFEVVGGVSAGVPAERKEI
jgi:CHAT domain-containing protein